MTTPAPKLISHHEAAALLNITEATLRFWRCKGKGPRFIKFGPTKRAGIAYDPADIVAWLDAHKYDSTTAAALVAASRAPVAPRAPIIAPWLQATV